MSRVSSSLVLRGHTSLLRDRENNTTIFTALLCLAQKKKRQNNGRDNKKNCDDDDVKFTSARVLSLISSLRSSRIHQTRWGFFVLLPLCFSEMNREEKKTQSRFLLHSCPFSPLLLPINIPAAAADEEREREIEKWSRWYSIEIEWLNFFSLLASFSCCCGSMVREFFNLNFYFTRCLNINFIFSFFLFACF